MTDDEYLEAQRKALAESVEFFRTGNKFKRERWVAREYLTNLGLSVAENELASPPQDPPDVLYRDASFEIKEILSDGRRRHQEYKEGLQKAIEATASGDLVEKMLTPRDVTVSGVCTRILKEATALAEKKYSHAVRRSLDLLFYVNLNDVFDLVETPFPDFNALESLGYRSVAFVMGYRSSTLVAMDAAPSFVKAAVGRIVHRKVGDNGIFNL